VSAARHDAVPKGDHILAPRFLARFALEPIPGQNALGAPDRHA
jgi:hypothetical protein